MLKRIYTPPLVKEAEQQKKKPLWPYFAGAVLLALLILIPLLMFLSGQGEPPATSRDPIYVGVENLPEWVDVQLIRVDGASRRGEKLEKVRDIALHYVGNPASSAQANRNYFDSPASTASSHFIVGLDGEVILCVPLDEKSSATNERNLDTISIEVCHPDETGKFKPSTHESLFRLLVWLCEEFDLSGENIIRHYDVTGKKCPLYYVENEDEWQELKEAVDRKLKEGNRDEKNDRETT